MYQDNFFGKWAEVGFSIFKKKENKKIVDFLRCFLTTKREKLPFSAFLERGKTRGLFSYEA